MMMRMSETKVNIVESALDLFARYGIRRVSMGDVAEASEVSRQTLYAHFKNKDELCAAAMRTGIGLLLEKIEAKWAESDSLEEKVDAYLQLAVIEPFRTLLDNPDLRDLQQGVGKVTYGIAKELEGEKISMLARQFECSAKALARHDNSPTELARYIVRTSTDLKYSSETLEQLEALMRTLRASTLALLRA